MTIDELIELLRQYPPTNPAYTCAVLVARENGGWGIQLVGTPEHFDNHPTDFPSIKDWVGARFRQRENGLP